MPNFYPLIRLGLKAGIGRYTSVLQITGKPATLKALDVFQTMLQSGLPRFIFVTKSGFMMNIVEK